MTTLDIFLDDTHDLTLDGADLKVTTEDNAVKQRLSIRLQFLLEEWFLDNTQGLPYTQFIFEQGSSLEDIYALFRNEILNTQGVDDIVSLNLTPDTREKGLTVEFSVNRGTTTDIIEVTA